MQLALKRLMDVVCSLLGLVLLSPILGGCAIAVVSTSSGPAIFRQRRLGLYGRPFEILKFRTMYVDAPELRNADGSTFSSDHDPRVTKVGRFLRRSSLDELPQLWNVLAGEMSLIGPRPDQCNQLALYTANEHEKLAMRPGLSGLAQISGRNGIAWDQRKRLDCEYVRNWSLALDMRILLLTLPYVLFRRGINNSAATVSD
ncbi:MAG: sugar transferase [Bryobacterales bacterium]|nr:sugar transferase [Bryobacterales bacterium]